MDATDGPIMQSEASTLGQKNQTPPATDQMSNTQSAQSGILGFYLYHAARQAGRQAGKDATVAAEQRFTN